MIKIIMFILLPVIGVLSLKIFFSGRISSKGYKILKGVVFGVTILLIIQIIAAFTGWFLAGYKTSTFWLIFTMFGLCTLYVFREKNTNWSIRTFQVLGISTLIILSSFFVISSLEEYHNNVLFEDEFVRIENTFSSNTEVQILPAFFEKKFMFEKRVYLRNMGEHWHDIEKKDVESINYEHHNDTYFVNFNMKDGSSIKTKAK
jgi:hypothetical protein